MGLVSQALRLERQYDVLFAGQIEPENSFCDRVRGIGDRVIKDEVIIPGRRPMLRCDLHSSV